MKDSKTITSLPHSRKIYHIQKIFTLRPQTNQFELFLLLQFNKKAFILQIDKQQAKKQMVQLFYEFECPKECGLPTCGYFYQDPLNHNIQRNGIYFGTSKGFLVKFKIRPNHRGKLQTYICHDSPRPQILSCSSNSDGSILIVLNLFNQLIILDSTKLQKIHVLVFPADITATTNIIDIQSKQIFLCTAFNNQKPLYFFPINRILHKFTQAKKNDAFLHYYQKTTRKYIQEEETDAEIVTIAEMVFEEGFIGKRVICGSFSRQKMNYFVSVYETEHILQQNLYSCLLVYRFQLEDMPNLLHLSLYGDNLVNIHSNTFFTILDHQERKKKAQLTIKKYEYPWCFIVDEDPQKFLFFMIKGYHTHNQSTTENLNKQSRNNDGRITQQLIRKEFLNLLQRKQKFWNIFSFQIE